MEKTEIKFQVNQPSSQSSATNNIDLRSRMTFEQIRSNDFAQLKGASIWLTAFLLAREGYALKKRKFFYALYLRNQICDLDIELSDNNTRF